MNPVEYYNGNSNIDVYSIEYLLTPSQELADSMATGPQDELYTALERFNSRLPDNVKLTVTPSWNWKPGTIPKFKEYLWKNIYRFDSKATSLTHMMKRGREWANSYRYWENTLAEIESTKGTLKREGFSANVDIDEFKEKLSDIVNRIIKQCENVKQMTNGSVDIDVVTGNIDKNPRYAILYVDIMMTDLEINIFQGEKCLQKVKLCPIHIIASISLRKFIQTIDSRRNFSSSLTFRGLYCSTELPNRRSYRRTHSTYFPYIATPNIPYNSHDENPKMIYQNVCLDRYTDEVKQSFLSLNWVDMAMSLMSWAQYYSIEHSNPYNNLRDLQIGMPKEYSKEYKHAVGIRTDCGPLLYNMFETVPRPTSKEQIVGLNKMHNYCNSIGCQFSDICTSYKENNIILENMKNETIICISESLIGEMMEMTDLFSENTNTYKYVLIDYFGEVGVTESHQDFWSQMMWKIRQRSESYLIDTAYLIYQELNLLGEQKAIPVDEDILSDEQKRQAVMQWATGGH